MSRRLFSLLREGAAAYVRTLWTAPSNAKRYLLTVALQNVGIGLLGTLFALHVRAQGLPSSVVGDVEGALALSSGAVCLLLPPLVQVVGYRWLLLGASVAFGLSRFGQALPVGAAAIVALGLLYGLGDGIIRSVGAAFLSENAPADSKLTMLFTADFALRVMASFVGALAGGVLPTLLGSWLSEPEALRWSVGAAGLVMLASAAPVLGIRETSRPAGRTRRRYLATVRSFQSWRRLLGMAVPQAVISFGAGLVMPFVPLFLRTHAGASVAQIGVIQGASSVVMAIATLATPLLVKRFGSVGAIVVTQVASLPFMLTLPLARSLALIAVAMWVRAALMNMAWPVFNQVAVDGVPSQDKPLMLGWINVAWSVAWFAGSVLGGRIAASSLTVGYFYAAALYLIGAVATWLLLRDTKIGAEPVGAAAPQP
ncbi:MAG: MFS transporter [Anaerosomatales bacterium]|nr:MFS transporter [Anaerosomatales bacterium]